MSNYQHLYKPISSNLTRAILRNSQYVTEVQIFIAVLHFNEV